MSVAYDLNNNSEIIWWKKKKENRRHVYLIELVRTVKITYPSGMVSEVVDTLAGGNQHLTNKPLHDRWYSDIHTLLHTFSNGDKDAQTPKCKSEDYGEAVKSTTAYEVLNKNKVKLEVTMESYWGTSNQFPEDEYGYEEE